MTRDLAPLEPQSDSDDGNDGPFILCTRSRHRKTESPKKLFVQSADPPRLVRDFLERCKGAALSVQFVTKWISKSNPLYEEFLFTIVGSAGATKTSRHGSGSGSGSDGIGTMAVGYFCLPIYVKAAFEPRTKYKFLADGFAFEQPEEEQGVPVVRRDDRGRFGIRLIPTEVTLNDIDPCAPGRIHVLEGRKVVTECGTLEYNSDIDEGVWEVLISEVTDAMVYGNGHPYLVSKPMIRNWLKYSWIHQLAQNIVVTVTEAMKGPFKVQPSQSSIPHLRTLGITSEFVIFNTRLPTRSGRELVAILTRQSLQSTISGIKGEKHWYLLPHHIFEDNHQVLATITSQIRAKRLTVQSGSPQLVTLKHRAEPPVLDLAREVEINDSHILVDNANRLIRAEVVEDGESLTVEDLRTWILDSMEDVRQGHQIVHHLAYFKLETLQLPNRTLLRYYQFNYRMVVLLKCGIELYRLCVVLEDHPTDPQLYRAPTILPLGWAWNSIELTRRIPHHDALLRATATMTTTMTMNNNPLPVVVTPLQSLQGTKSP